MVRTTTGTGAGEIQWERPSEAIGEANRRWHGEERPTFLQLFVPLAALAIGSILALGVIAAALFGLLGLVL